MKKLLFISCLFLFSLVANAQREVTKFLGVPVDGTKTEMIQRLKTKGFRSASFDKEILEGEFNGKSVFLHIETNNGKVCRVMVIDSDPVSESKIKIRYNNLCRQFVNDPNYDVSNSGLDQIIPESEDISHEMDVNKKSYEAAFFQMTQSDVRSFLNSRYTQSQLANPTAGMKAALDDFIAKKSVWFMIEKEGYDKYKILMFYDNGYNR